MPAFSLVVLAATLALFNAHVVKGKKTPPVTIMPSDSSMAQSTLSYFTGSDYSEVVLQQATDELTGEAMYLYRWESEDPIKHVYLIPPHHIELDDSERDYAEGKDFIISCTPNSVTLKSKHLGFYHMRVVTKKQLGRGRRAIESSSNVILNAGLSSTCGDLCSTVSSCPPDNCDNRTRVNFVCPPYDPCSFISKLGALKVPQVANGNLVVSCTEFVHGVCEKYEENGNKSVDVLWDGHGANGIFCFGPPTQPFDCIYKGSPCYESICRNLKGKVKSLTILACSVAGGAVGAELIQCLADCLGAEVKAYKKNLWAGLDGGGSLVWSTIEGYKEPCVAVPTPTLPYTSTSGTSATPTIRVPY